MSTPPFFEAGALDAHAFLGGRVRLRQPRRGFRSGVDAVYLAASCPAHPGETVLELGIGAGVASFCLAARVPGLTLHGLEAHGGYAALAESNAAALGHALNVHRGDVAAPPPALKALSVDGVLANPPWFRDGLRSHADRAQARHEAAPLGAWIDCALRRLAPGGWLAVIQHAERLVRCVIDRQSGLEVACGAEQKVA